MSPCRTHENHGFRSIPLLVSEINDGEATAGLSSIVSQIDFNFKAVGNKTLDFPCLIKSSC